MSRVPSHCPPGFPARYTVRAGDTVWSIARVFGVSPGQLIAANQHIPNHNLIFSGDVLCVPDSSSTSHPLPTGRSPEHGPTALHVMGENQTLGDLEALYGVSAETLLEANPQLPNRDVVTAFEIVVLARVHPLKGPELHPRQYIVQTGDTLKGIARRFDVTPEAITDANRFPRPVPGLILAIPSPSRPGAL